MQMKNGNSESESQCMQTEKGVFLRVPARWKVRESQGTGNGQGKSGIFGEKRFGQGNRFSFLCKQNFFQVNIDRHEMYVHVYRISMYTHRVHFEKNIFGSY